MEDQIYTLDESPLVREVFGLEGKYKTEWSELLGPGLAVYSVELLSVPRVLTFIEELKERLERPGVTNNPRKHGVRSDMMSPGTVANIQTTGFQRLKKILDEENEIINSRYRQQTNPSVANYSVDIPATMTQTLHRVGLSVRTAKIIVICFLLVIAVIGFWAILAGGTADTISAKTALFNSH